MCITSSSGTPRVLPVDSRSICCPPAMPREPAATERVFTMSSCARGSSANRCSESSWKASECSASPTRSAVASSYSTCTVGLPRRNSSSSMQGRSSCTSEYAWISSTAAAAISSRSDAARDTSPAANVSSGRTRLPPSRVAYRIASCKRFGATWHPGNTVESTVSMRLWSPPIHAWKSVSAIFTVVRRNLLERLQDFPLEHLDLLLRRLQLLLAKPCEFQPALVGGERLLQRQLTAFHAADDFLELG